MENLNRRRIVSTTADKLIETASTHTAYSKHFSNLQERVDKPPLGE
jgi:coenzyme F420-reducing hydrogenase beta subunit